METTYKNLWEPVKVVLRGKFIEMSAYIKTWVISKPKIISQYLRKTTNQTPNQYMYRNNKAQYRNQKKKTKRIIKVSMKQRVVSLKK